MKSLHIFAVTLGIAAACISCGCVILPIRGNGVLVTSEKTLSSFEEISVSGNADVRFHPSEEYRAVVAVDSNLEKYTEIYTKDNTLHIGTKTMVHTFAQYVVDVYCPALTGVSVSGSGKFSSDDTIAASTFDARVSGSGAISGTIHSDNFSARISGSGEITVAGSSKDLSINISGSGEFSGNEFTANNATVRISGSGEVDICVTENLNANISGSGELNYRGDPQTDSTVRGSGEITKM